MNRSRLFWEGMIAGLIGYLVVVVLVGSWDLLSGQSFFHTPSVLGRALMGEFDPTRPGAAAGPVLAFNGVHVLAFAFVGIGISWVVLEVERHPVLWYLAFFAVMSFVLVSFFVLAIVAEPVAAELSRPAIVVANALAALAIAFYLHRAHPRLRQAVEAHDDPEYDDA